LIENIKKRKIKSSIVNINNHFKIFKIKINNRYTK
jgi:hypothetical protein